MSDSQNKAHRGEKPLVEDNSMHRRAHAHDYSRRGMYLVTLVARDRTCIFGSLAGPASDPRVAYSPFGERVLKEELPKISRFYPNVGIVRQCIMPDHIHLIIYVKEDMPKGKCLGNVISGFKLGCNRCYWTLYGKTEHGIFEEGYNDKILLSRGQLDRWIKYVEDNPRRLALKKLHPDLFRVVSTVSVCGENCRMVGNLFLLDHPDKMAVVFHRRYSQMEVQRLRAEWLAFAAAGGVLVSGAIAPLEREVLAEALRLGGSVIRLVPEGFSQYYKPSGLYIDACAEGRVLELSLFEYQTKKNQDFRARCLRHNALAERIAAGK